jgi:pimeloyl-ACP methyl ester carboxylesterase
MRELAIELIPTMVGPGGEAEVVHDAVDLMAQIPPDSYRAPCGAGGFDQRRRWPLTMPALVMAGTHDKVSTPLVRRMAERLPPPPTEIDAGHLAPFEEPAAFAARCASFWPASITSLSFAAQAHCPP